MIYTFVTHFIYGAVFTLIGYLAGSGLRYLTDKDKRTKIHACDQCGKISIVTIDGRRT